MKSVIDKSRVIMNSFLIVASFLATTIAGHAPVMAAGATNACQSIGEEIIPLRVPNFDVPILWKRVMGVDGPDIPGGSISLADSGMIVFGTTADYSNTKGLAPARLYLARLDVNGKVIWEKKIETKNLVRTSGGIAVKDRIAVLSQTGEKDFSARVDLFDGLGALKNSFTIADARYNLVPVGITANPSGKDFTIAFWAVNRKNTDDNLTVIKQVSQDGKVLASRQYLPGVASRLENFRRTADGNFIGAGQIKSNGIASGWIFVIDGQSGDLTLQRPYTRGYKAILRAVTQDTEGNYIVAGDSVPTDGGMRAAWIMKTDGDGNPIWQKYVQGKYAFSGRDVEVSKEGRILLLVNARPSGKSGGREHVRLMTFTPQGLLQGDEALIEGANAQATDLSLRDNSRIVTGVTQAGLKDYSLAKNEKGAGYDFWVLGLPKLSKFEDPCSTIKINDSFDEGF